MTKPRTIGAFFAFVLGLTALAAQGAEKETAGEAGTGTVTSQETPGKTLAERVPPVTGRAFSKRHRVELYPQLGLSLNDPFFNTGIVGAGLDFYVFESIGIGVNGEYFLGAQTTIPVGGRQPAMPAYNRPVYTAGLDVLWAPLYGKISLFAESVLHFDVFLAVGGGMAGLKTGGSAFGPEFAVGAHVFFASWGAVRIELRDQMYEASRDPAANVAKSLNSMLAATLGFCFYIPSNFDRTGS